jgi:hypothetical protein
LLKIDHETPNKAIATNPKSTIYLTHGAFFRASKNMVGKTEEYSRN